MKKGKAFIANLFMSAIRFGIILLFGICIFVIGIIWIDSCVYVGLGVVALYVVTCIVSALRMQRLINYRSEDDSDFNELMDSFLQNPHNVLSGIIEEQEKNKNLHGKELLALSDEDLLETVRFQNYDIAETIEDEDKELEQFLGARRKIYVLDLFDSEVQNGGLCQFFVNSSRIVAPFVSECLEAVGADEHCKLFDRFIAENNIDVCDLESFKAFTKRGYIKQMKRFDFDSFDDKYYELPVLEEKLVSYIRDNIYEF